MADHGTPATLVVSGGGESPKPRRKGKLLFIAVPVLLCLAGAGAWFSGLVPKLLGHKAATHVAGAPDTPSAEPPVYVDVPEIICNLNVPGKRPSFLKMHAKLELQSKSDEAPVSSAMPRIQDLFQTYLRDMRPEELRGSEGSYRLREELIGRASIAATPAHVMDVLFVELVIE